MSTRQPTLPRFAAAIAVALALLAASAAAFLATAAHAAPAWQPAHVAAADGSLPAIAVDDSGNAYAAWTTAVDIRLAVRPAGGAWQVPEILSAAPAAKTQFTPGPAIGVDAQGNATVAWREQSPSGSLAIKAARRTKSGATTIQEIAANGFPGDSFDLSVSRNGGAAIAYFTNGAPGDGRLTVAIRPAGAVEFAPAESLPLTTYPFDTPVVDIGEDGTVAAAYSPYAVWAVVRPPGGPWGSPEPVESEVSRSANANISVESGGHVVIAYFGSGGKLTVRERPKNGRFGAAETLPGPSLPGSASADFLAPIALARARDNDVTIAWRQVVSPTEQIVYAAELPDGSGALGNPERIATGGPVEYVRAAVDSGGAATVSWRGFDDPSTQNGGDAADRTGPVYAATRPSGSAFSSTTTLIGAGSTAPALDAGPSGTALVAWGHPYDGGACSQIEASGLSDGPFGGAPIARLCTPITADAAAGVPPGATPPPRIRLSTRRAQRVGKKRLLKLSFVCGAPCSGLITSSVRHKPRRGTRRVKSVKLAPSKYMAVAGGRVTIRYKLTSGQLTVIKRMLGERGKARFVARIVTFDVSGNRSVTTAQIPLKR